MVDWEGWHSGSSLALGYPGSISRMFLPAMPNVETLSGLRLERTLKRIAPRPQETRNIQGKRDTGFPSSGIAQLRKEPDQRARLSAVCRKLGCALRVAVRFRCTRVHGRCRTDHKSDSCPRPDRDL